MADDQTAELEELADEIQKTRDACNDKLSELESLEEPDDIEVINLQDDIILTQKALISKLESLVALQSSLLSSGSTKRESGDEKEDDEEVESPQQIRRPAGRRGGVSAEVPQTSNEPFVPRTIPKSFEAECRIKAVLKKNILFIHLDDAQLRIVVDAMFQVRYERGDKIIVQGQPADSFYIIESGECNVFVSSGGQPPKMVLTLGAGKSFGELALMYNCPRAATVQAKTGVVVWAVDRLTFQHIVLRTTGDKRQEYCSFLQNVPILENCSDEERSKIADVLTPLEYKDGDYIVTEGEEGDCFYLVVRGNCVCTKNINGVVTEVKRLCKGDYFGELALMRDQPRAANVIADGVVKVVTMDRASFIRLLGSCDDIMKRNIEAYGLDDQSAPEDTVVDTTGIVAEGGRVRRGGVSAEVRKPMSTMFIAKIVPKSVDAKARISAVLRSNILFQHLDDSQMKVVVDAMFQVKPKPGTNVITQGDSADSFYIIDSGEFDVFVAQRGEAPRLVLTLGPGKSFGELALMYNCPRAATVTARTAAVLWAVDRLTFQHIVLSTTGDRRKMYNKFLENVPILEGLTDEERFKIADVLSSQLFEPGEYIVRQDAEGDNFYILEAGEAVCTKSIDGSEPVEVKRLKKGDYFGELALLRDQPRAANVVAVSRVQAVSMDRASFVRLLGPVQKIMERTVKMEYGLAGSDDEGDAQATAHAFPPPLSSATAVNQMRTRRGGVSAEVFEGAAETFVPRVVEKSDTAALRISQVLSNNILFGHLDEHQLDVIVQSMEQVNVDTGTNIITQGDPGESFYIIDSGECEVFVSSGGGEAKLVLTIGPGQSFGELALMYNCSRAATVKSKTPCVLWAIDRLMFQHMVLRTQADKRAMYSDFLMAVPILVDLDASERSKIADVLASQTFEDGEFIVQQDDEGNNFYIIEEGEAVCKKSIDGRPPVEVKRLKKGDYFGELALLKDQPRAASVIARGRVKALSMDRSSFIRLLGPVTDIMERNSSNYNIARDDDDQE